MYPPPGQQPPGHQPYGQPGFLAPGAPRTSGAAIASLILGILGCIPIITSLLAVILGIIGIRKTSDPRYTGKGMAIAGLILGLIGLLGWGTMGGGLYALYVTSRPVANVAQQFTTHIASGNVAAAQALCESNVTQAELQAMVDQFKQWGALKDLMIPAREAKTTGGQTTWELQGIATFANDGKTAKFTLRKQSDGSYKITSVEFE